MPRQHGGIVFGMADENEIRGGRDHAKPQRGELADKFLAALHNGGAGAFKVCVVAQRGNGACLRQTIERVGIETVFNPFEADDQFRLSDGKANAQSGKRT